MMKEINLKLETRKVNMVLISDMERMFGRRIKNAKYFENGNEHTVGLVHAKMVELCKWWKFWNLDIKKAYKNYCGYLLMPYSVIQEPPVIQYNNGRIYPKHLLQEAFEKYSEINITDNERKEFKVKTKTKNAPNYKP